MLIKLHKFGTTLISHPAGKEALAAFQPTLNELKEGEAIEVDFTGVEVLTPSWADEFITKLYAKYPDKVSLTHTENPSVRASLEILGLKE